ncbi:uncharacterized protein LOC141680097 [Apium graveolens]|uniref:uncharacterized protein LOC141680097 n=1 Tax=Apium graveolens TaxID=4045 RepID=UPI003D79BFDD
MSMCLEAIDPEYLNRIFDGPHRPMKLVVTVVGQEKNIVDKEKKDYFPEDLSSIMKDAKVKHILHSSLDSVISNRVIRCKSAKEIWDTLEVKCQGTTAIKKNKRTILTQDFKHFNSKPDESLTEIYDRFQKLINELSLVDKKYDLEDSNLKFFLALLEKWDLKVTLIRDNVTY